MTHITCMLTVNNRDQLRDPTIGNRLWATFTFLIAHGEDVVVGPLYFNVLAWTCTMKTATPFPPKINPGYATYRMQGAYNVIGVRRISQGRG